jgi:hypothetical protein
MKKLLRKLSGNGIIYPLIFELAWGVGVLAFALIGLLSGIYDGAYETAITVLTILALIIGGGIIILTFIVICKFPFKKALPTMIFWLIQFLFFILGVSCILEYILDFFNSDFVEALIMFVIPPIWILFYLVFPPLFYILCGVIIAIPCLKLIRQKDKEKWENYHSE